MEITWLPIATLVIAVTGAVLGVLNTWRTFNQDRVRVRVKPSYCLFTDGRECLGVEVTNLSNFGITITHIGFTLRGGEQHMQLLPLMLHPEGSLPVRLEPRTGFTAFAAPGATDVSGMARADRAYVKTACGLRVLSSRKDLATALHNLALARK